MVPTSDSHLISLVTVSYTHLDVYKRQDGEWIANYDRGWNIEPNCEEDNLALCILLNELN